MWTCPHVDNKFAMKVLLEAKELASGMSVNTSPHLRDLICGFLTRKLETYVIIDEITNRDVIKGNYRSGFYGEPEDHGTAFIIGTETKIIGCTY
jgi:hypothetical protein